ncbi:reticulon-4 isoform X2 [Oenanthe melanoleuca]|uniref:reticulon-4 isoform X2 n=1 Tax=Oenanthe melanoleuca TaxID=2939378 RepID=UPI0024C1C1C2|nr:reticulon-4 isoform X2 [Oenanthe melanoleuca]
MPKEQDRDRDGLSSFPIPAVRMPRDPSGTSRLREAGLGRIVPGSPASPSLSGNRGGFLALLKQKERMTPLLVEAGGESRLALPGCVAGAAGSPGRPHSSAAPPAFPALNFTRLRGPAPPAPGPPLMHIHEGPRPGPPLIGCSLPSPAPIGRRRRRSGRGAGRPRPRLPGGDSQGVECGSRSGGGSAARASPRTAPLIVPPAPGTMDELDQSPLVSSSSSGPARPQQPQFNYQFVLDDEKEEEEEEEEEDEDEDFDEQLEVMERKPAAAPAAAPQERPPQLLDLGGPTEPPRPAAPEPPQPDWSPRGAVSSSSSSATTPSPAQEQPPAPARPAQPQPPKPEPAVAPRSRGSSSGSAVVDLLYWRDIKKTGVVFGASLFLLLSLTVFSIVSVTAYIALALLSVTISFRIYKGVIQAIQKSDEGHPFRAYLDSDVAVSEELIQKYSNVVLGHVNGTVRELRRLFLVDDLVDSLKFAVLMWVFTYVGALFNGLTLLILALISLFSVPVIYERHQAQIDHYLGLVNKNVKDAMAKIQAKIPGLKRKTE